MYKLIASVASLTLAGSGLALAATSPNSPPAAKAALPPAVQQAQPAYHQANTASPVVVKPKKDMQAANQTVQTAGQGGIKTATTATGSPTTANTSTSSAAAQGQRVYHEANTASPVAAKPKQEMQAANQAQQKTPQASVKTASASATVAPNFAASSLMSRLDAVSSRIHLARKSGKLTPQQFMQLHSDYSMVASNIERAQDRFGREIPDGRLWNLNGQIRYLSNQASKLIG